MNLVLAECVSFSSNGSVPAASLGFPCQKFVPSSDIGSVRSVRLGFWTYDANSDFVAFVYIT